MKIVNSVNGLLCGVAALLSAVTFATDFVPTITRVEGTAKIFSNPSKTKQGAGPHAMFESMFYTVAEAKVRMKLENGNIIQTGENSKVRLVYTNGDLFTVSANSAFKVSLEERAGKTDTKVDMMFGKLRSFIVSGGPRTGMKVKTKTAVMGVRGTDFAVSAYGGEQGTTLSVLRGKVAIANQPVGSKSDALVKPVEVPAGSSASVKAPPEPVASKPGAAQSAAPVAPVAPIKIEKTDTLALLNIQKESAIKRPENVPVAEAKELESLEKKSAEATIVDIKKDNPELLNSVDGKALNIDNIDAIQTLTVKNLYEKAPKPADAPAPSGKIDDHADEIYDKYFKMN